MLFFFKKRQRNPNYKHKKSDCSQSLESWLALHTTRNLWPDRRGYYHGTDETSMHQGREYWWWWSVQTPSPEARQGFLYWSKRSTTCSAASGRGWRLIKTNKATKYRRGRDTVQCVQCSAKHRTLSSGIACICRRPVLASSTIRRISENSACSSRSTTRNARN